MVPLVAVLCAIAGAVLATLLLGIGGLRYLRRVGRNGTFVSSFLRALPQSAGIFVLPLKDGTLVSVSELADSLQEIWDEKRAAPPAPTVPIEVECDCPLCLQGRAVLEQARAAAQRAAS